MVLISSSPAHNYNKWVKEITDYKDQTYKQCEGVKVKWFRTQSNDNTIKQTNTTQHVYLKDSSTIHGLHTVHNRFSKTFSNLNISQRDFSLNTLKINPLGVCF